MSTLFLIVTVYVTSFITQLSSSSRSLLQTCTTAADCNNVGQCISGVGCICESGWRGDNCEINIDECDPNPCLNGATCQDGINAFNCQCPPGFTGLTCENAVPNIDCECQNGGICNSETGECTCQSGWEGDKCEINIDDCDPNPCLNGGECRDSVNSYSCSCINGFTGEECQYPCEADGDCNNGGRCENNQCVCVNGFSGSNCDVRPRVQPPIGCEQNPCKNRGICFPRQDGGVLCACPAGYEGNTCQNRVTRTEDARDEDNESPDGDEESGDDEDEDSGDGDDEDEESGDGDDEDGDDQDGDDEDDEDDDDDDNDDDEDDEGDEALSDTDQGDEVLTDTDESDVISDTDQSDTDRDEAMIFSNFKHGINDNLEGENMNYEPNENVGEEEVEFKLESLVWIIGGILVGFAIFICGLCWYQNRRLEKIINGVNEKMTHDNVLEYSQEKNEDV